MKKYFKFIALFIIGCLFFTGCGEKKDTQVDKKIDLNVPDNIKVETFYNNDNTSLMLKLTNIGNDDISNMNIKVDYPDRENSLLTEDEVLVKNFKANSTTYASLLLPIDNNFDSYMPEKIDLDIITNSDEFADIADTSQMVNEIIFDYNIEDNFINYSITNNTGKIIGTVTAIVVYFKDGKPVDSEYINAFDIEETYSSDREILYYEDDSNNNDDGELNYVDYDNVEVYVTSILDDYVESEGEYSEDELFDLDVDEDEDLEEEDE